MHSLNIQRLSHFDPNKLSRRRSVQCVRARRAGAVSGDGHVMIIIFMSASESPATVYGVLSDQQTAILDILTHLYLTPPYAKHMSQPPPPLAGWALYLWTQVTRSSFVISTSSCREHKEASCQICMGGTPTVWSKTLINEDTISHHINSDH